MTLKNTIFQNRDKLDTKKEVIENDRKLELMPNKRDNKRFKKLFNSLEPFERLTKRLQNDNLTIRTLRAFFDDIITKHPQ